MDGTPARSLRRDTSTATLGLVKRLRLEEAARPVVRRLPQRWHVAIRLWKQRMRWRRGEPAQEVWGTLVPEQRITEVYGEALALLRQREGCDRLGDYLEFGVYVGTSLSCMHAALEDHGLDQVRLFGFDSFEGFPADAATDAAALMGRWKPGDDKVPIEATRENLTRKGVDWDRTTLVKGWFDETLTPELLERHEIRKASVIMVDCDLYSSSKLALEYCAPLIRDHAVILFDDWWPATIGEANEGQRRAWDEFLADNPDIVATELASYRPEAAKVFLVSRRRGNGIARRVGLYATPFAHELATAVSFA